MGLFGILLGLALLVWLAYRGWSILLLAPGAALIAAAFAGGPILAYWTQTFMDSGSRFISKKDVSRRFRHHGLSGLWCVARRCNRVGSPWRAALRWYSVGAVA